MFVLGHVGLAAGGAALLAGASRRRVRVDYPFLVLGALLPDLIDKPLGVYLLADILGSGRTFGHSLLFLGILAVAALATRSRPRAAFAWIAFGCAAHLVLDRLWREPEVLLWPLLGVRVEAGGTDRWTGQMLELLLSDPYVYVSEVVGGLVLAALVAAPLVRRLYTRQERAQQLRRGQRAPQR